MAAILLMVAYSLVDVHHIRNVVKTSRAEGAILLATLLATLFMHLEFAIDAIGRKRTSGARAINVSTRNRAENTGASGVFAPAE